MHDFRLQGLEAPDWFVPSAGITPGKRTLTQSLPAGRTASPVQARAAAADGAAAGPRASAEEPFWFGSERIQAAADHGVAGASSPLPHLDAIQRSFGRHDVGGIRAQVGGAAAEAARTISAEAYATGDRVAFAGAPDLHTAAHEAAHVVQQRAGVQLKGGVGEVGDVYERHADEVADLVVRGESAEAVLDAHVGGGTGSGGVQRKMVFLAGTEYLDIDGDGAGIALDGYQATLREAVNMDNTITVRAQTPSVGTAMYSPNPDEYRGEINIAPIKPSQIGTDCFDYNSRLISMAHETRHGIDDLTKTVRYRGNGANKIHSEYRAFATQSAVAWQLAQEGQRVEERYLNDIASYASRAAFMNPASSMTGVTRSYLRLYEIILDPSVDDATNFMTQHIPWIDEGILLFNTLKPAVIPVVVAQNLRPGAFDEIGWIDVLKGLGYLGGAVVTAYVVQALATHFGLL